MLAWSRRFALALSSPRWPRSRRENAPVAAARPAATPTSSRLSSCRRLCRSHLSPSMTSRGACAVNASGPRWRLAPCLPAHLPRTFAAALSPPERCCQPPSFRSPPRCCHCAPRSWSANRNACVAPATSCKNAPWHSRHATATSRPPGLRSRARDARRTRPHRARDPR